MSSLRSFSRQSRLLTKHDYGRVFDANTVRASSRHALFLALPNQQQCSRLGLVVAKKHVRTAVQRNRVKRLVREFFRHQDPRTPMDIVFLARADIGTLSNHDIQLQLASLWRKLQTKQPRG